MTCHNSHPHQNMIKMLLITIAYLPTHGVKVIKASLSRVWPIFIHCKKTYRNKQAPTQSTEKIMYSYLSNKRACPLINFQEKFQPTRGFLSLPFY